MSTPPSYSETFFNNKIKGLTHSGYNVVLFVQKNEASYTLCETRVAPKVYSKNIPFMFFVGFKVLVRLALYPKRLIRFIRLERTAKRSWIQLLKNIYNNSHILSSHLDWLHFGFATIALQSEHIAKAIDANMAVSCRGYDMDVYPLKHDNIYQLLWANVDKVHAISDYILKKAYSLGMLSETANAIITPAVEVCSHLKDKPKNSTLQIVTIARLHWIKGLIETLEALALLKHQGIVFTYTLIGDGAEFQNLKFAVHQLKLSENVVFTGILKHEAVIDLLSKSDIYLQYSYSEGFCNAVLEAQAMGCLCVVSDGGALPENVLHGETGWVVKKRNPNLLTKTIMDIINLTDKEKETIKTKAQKRITDHFNILSQNKAFEAFYDTSNL